MISKITYYSIFLCLKCAPWDFAGGDTEFGNPYLAINIDMLHQADLGVFKTLMNIVQDMSKELDVNPIPKLDRRLSVIKESACFFEFQYLEVIEEAISHQMLTLPLLSIAQSCR